MPVAAIFKKWPRSFIPYSLLMIVIGFNIFFSGYSLQKHAAFKTAGFDLGIWDQKVWVALHGNPFGITTQSEVEISLGDHVDVVVLSLLLPFYALYSSPKTLMVIQVFWVSLGAFPIYWMARDRLQSNFAGLVFALVYLAFPALQAAVTFDVHGITFAVPLLAFALWATCKEHYGLFLTAAVLAMGCQEEVSLLTLMMGLYIALIKRRWGAGGLTVALSLVWFIIANVVIIPTYSLSGDNFHLYRYQALGHSTFEIIGTIFTRPDIVLAQIFAGDKKFYWVRLTMPTAFLAVLDPFTLLMAAPALLINTLSSYPPTYQLDRFHSSAAIVPFVVVAGINGLARLVDFAAPKFKTVTAIFLQNTLLAMVLLVTLLYQVQFGHTPVGRNFSWPVVTKHHLKAETMMAQIPPEAAVAAQNNLVPRVSHRNWVFILPKLSQRGRPAEYIAVDMRGTLTPYRYIEEYCTQIKDFLNNPNYGLVFSDDGLLLFR